MRRFTDVLIVLGLCWFALPAVAFNIYIDPGHYVRDKRSDLEIETNLAVGLKLRALLESDTPPGIQWNVSMSRDDDDDIEKKPGEDSLRARTRDANEFGADLFISIHCNASRGIVPATGTETFWCDAAPNPDIWCDVAPNPDKGDDFARLVQKHMVHRGEWRDRRVEEDCSYLSFHIFVLRDSEAPGCLNEIGFVDNEADADKLRDDWWRDPFALAYRDAIYEFFHVQLPLSEQSISIPLFHGWNLISIPGTPVHSDPRSLAGPGSQIKFPLYQYKDATGSQAVRQLKLGEGYLICTDNPNGEEIQVPYIPSPRYTISLKKGLNPIGSVSDRAAFSDFEGSAPLEPVVYRLDPDPKNLILSPVLPAVLEPGIGYYVYAHVPGTLTVKASPPGAPVAFRTERPISTVGLPLLPSMRFETVQASWPRTNFVPRTTQVLANFPNPFNPETWIPFQVKDASVVTIHIYNAAGHRVRKLGVGYRAAGVYETKARAVYWDGQNDWGEPVASGLYFYTLQAGAFEDTKKMLLLK